MQKLEEARKLARVAWLLLDAEEPESAVNRAYYAMFWAARAAPESVDPRLL